MQWQCPHGTTYAGSEEFVRGAREAHQLCPAYAVTAARSRSAITGRFVKLATAIRHPRTTIRERRRKS